MAVLQVTASSKGTSYLSVQLPRGSTDVEVVIEQPLASRGASVYAVMARNRLPAAGQPHLDESAVVKQTEDAASAVFRTHYVLVC
jgi:expansin (peptidoglycan-binding protein)